MLKPDQVISYLELCNEERANLQKGMNFHLHGGYSVILMSLRVGAPYKDKVMDEGRTVIYEGHDEFKTAVNPNPKVIDQPYNRNGKLTENGLFYEAAKNDMKELVKVYEKMKDGIWVYNGLFTLTDAWTQEEDGRVVFKFRLELLGDSNDSVDQSGSSKELENPRMIPPEVKREVWKRDRGKCSKCGDDKNLHFDHIIPYSKGGSSLVSANIQLLCAKHNLEKHDKIQ